MAAMTDLRSLLRFTALSQPGELDEAGIIELVSELHRRAEVTAQELVEVLEPGKREAALRVVLWLLRVGTRGGG
jgi:hypothetical protein